MADQLIRGSVRRGMGTGPGMQTWSHSDGVLAEEEAQLSDVTSYTSPGDGPVEKLPPALGLFRTESDRLALFQSMPVTRDHGGRRGAHIAHVFLFDEGERMALRDGSATSYWRSPSFRTQLTDAEIQSSQRPPPLAPVELAAIEPGPRPYGGRDELASFLDWVVREDKVAKLAELFAPRLIGTEKPILHIRGRAGHFLSAVRCLELLEGRPVTFLTYASDNPASRNVASFPFETCNLIASKELLASWRESGHLREFDWDGAVPAVSPTVESLTAQFIEARGALPHNIHRSAKDGATTLVSIDHWLCLHEPDVAPSSPEVEAMFALACSVGHAALRRCAVEQLSGLQSSTLVELGVPRIGRLLAADRWGDGIQVEWVRRILLRLIAAELATGDLAALLRTLERHPDRGALLDRIRMEIDEPSSAPPTSTDLVVACIALGAEPSLEALAELERDCLLPRALSILAQLENGSVPKALDAAIAGGNTAQPGVTQLLASFTGWLQSWMRQEAAQDESHIGALLAWLQPAPALFLEALRRMLETELPPPGYLRAILELPGFAAELLALIRDGSPTPDSGHLAVIATVAEELGAGPSSLALEIADRTIPSLLDACYEPSVAKQLRPLMRAAGRQAPRNVALVLWLQSTAATQEVELPDEGIADAFDGLPVRAQRTLARALLAGLLERARDREAMRTNLRKWLAIADQLPGESWRQGLIDPYEFGHDRLARISFLEHRCSSGFGREMDRYLSLEALLDDARRDRFVYSRFEDLCRLRATRLDEDAVRFLERNLFPPRPRRGWLRRE